MGSMAKTVWQQRPRSLGLHNEILMLQRRVWCWRSAALQTQGRKTSSVDGRTQGTGIQSERAGARSESAVGPCLASGAGRRNVDHDVVTKDSASLDLQACSDDQALSKT